MNHGLLDVLLDSWDRNNTILVNLLGAIPMEGLNARASADSPSVAGMFRHIHYVRLVFIEEDAPEFDAKAPGQEWSGEESADRLAVLLRESAMAVREVVRRKTESGETMATHYDHPVLFLQHMIWHEGYHHGQIKLALKLAGHPISDEQAGPLTWDVWMDKS